MGNPYGIRPIGMVAYLMNHTEGGFAQIGSNFVSGTGLDGDFVKQSMDGVEAEGISYDKQQDEMEFLGSVGTDITNHVFNPFELGLGHCINWNHEFRGKEALQKLKKTENCDTVTLVWNPEDLSKIYASQFVPDEEPYKQIDYPAVGAHALMGHFSSDIDWVLNEKGDKIGRSYGRTHSHFNRSMLSLASLDGKYREVGTEVSVLWGNADTPQIKVRAKVVPYPFNQHISNEGFDVNSVPSLT